MKTHPELLIEARRLETLGSEYERGGDFAAARFLLSLPDSPVRKASLGAEERSIMRRWIDVTMVEGMLEYRLWQSTSDLSEGENRKGESAPTLVMASDSAFDALAEGYERSEHDRLDRALAAFIERVEREEFGESIDPTLIEEIEKIVEADELAPAARLSAKADIVELLEGRLDPSEFIAVAIERQYRREVERESIEERPAQRVAIEQF